MIFLGTFFVTQISQMTQIFFVGVFFVPQISQISTDFFMESLCPISGGICNDRTGRFREICVTKNPTQIFLFVYNSVLFDLIY